VAGAVPDFGAFFFPPPPTALFPQFVQNLDPAARAVPQEEHFLVFSGLPQEEQNFPDASAPQDGHFIAFNSPDLPTFALPPGGGIRPIEPLK